MDGPTGSRNRDDYVRKVWINWVYRIYILWKVKNKLIDYLNRRTIDVYIYWGMHSGRFDPIPDFQSIYNHGMWSKVIEYGRIFD
jgi:hypothetical protein